MFLDNYYNKNDNGTIHVSRKQASDFAKSVAGDFNPIHDEDAKRFCVPGDLLFTLLLNHYGVSQDMTFKFEGMVGDGVNLVLPGTDSNPLVIADENDKAYLSVERGGDTTTDPGLVEDLSLRYVAFSGQTFPHILVPLMAEHNVMVNPDRPLVIYESMVIQLDRLDFSEPELVLASANLDVQGKRGNVSLEFEVNSAGNTVGHGKKTMVMSGLREYEQSAIEQLVNDYAARKSAYQG